MATKDSKDKKDSKESSSTDFKSPKWKFADGEKVLCFHGPLIYEAKCLQTRIDEKNKIYEYLIHYSGWNKSWDEWVPENRVLKFNDTNLQKQKDLHKAQKNEQKTKKNKRKTLTGGPDTPGGPDSRSSTPVNEKESKPKLTPVVTSTQLVQESAGDVVKKKKGRMDPAVGMDEQSLSKSDFKVKIPEELKYWIVEDWDLVSRQKKIMNLPATVTVDQVLDDYYNMKVVDEENRTQRESLIAEAVNCIREYFNNYLGLKLLYKPEKAQYSKILAANPDTPMSKIYGTVHLLRLFFKIGGVFVDTELEEKCIQFLLPHINDFLKFLAHNKAIQFNLQDYGVIN